MIGRRPVLLLLNGSIHTMSQDQPRVTALAIDRVSGRILATGDDSTIRALAGPLTDTLDLKGRTVLPGFIDAHTHLVGYAMTRLEVNVRDTHSEQEAVERAAARAHDLPVGDWITGHGWSIDQWSPQRLPTRASLDAAIPDHPVALWNHSYHAVWVNGAALRAAGITAETADPPEGTIARDGSGEPTGMFFENSAIQLVERVIPEPPEERILAEVRNALASMRARGITGIHNIEDAHSLHLLQRLHARGELTPRVLLYIPRASLPDAVKLGLEAGFGDDYLRFGGVKLFMDGALGSFTAAMFDPYEGQPQNRGLLTLTDEDTTRMVTEAAGGRIGVAIHAIGDRAVHAALDGIEHALQQTSVRTARDLPDPVRLRLEHVQLAAPEDIQRMARLGVIASVQPFHAVVDRDAAERYWGLRHKRAYAYNTLRTSGIPLALGSDVPVDTCDPLRVLQAAVARTDDQTPERGAWLPDEALPVAQALWSYTAGAAWAGGQEAHQGMLEAGKLADMVVLADDPFTLPAQRLAQLEVVATLAGGELVHGSLE